MADNDYQQEDMSDQPAGSDCRCPEPDCETGAPKWMVTFGDMMSLLVCFFVILLSFSTMDVVKYRSLVGSLKSAFGSQSAIASKIITGQQTAISLGESQPGKKSMTEEELEHELVSAVENEGLTGEATLARTDRGIVLKVKGNILFEAGTAKLMPETLPFLQKVAWVCRGFDRKIYIEGHTDNLPTQSNDFGSNWELSSSRASTVVRYFTEVEHLAPEKFVACGYAATVPIASNSTVSGRIRNRRVEFVFSGHPGGEDSL